MVVVVGLAGAAGLASADRPRVGRRARVFSLYDTRGTLRSLSHWAYRGPAKPRRPKKAVVLEFFRTDCKPCVKGLPRLAALQRRYRGRPVQVLMVALLEKDEGERKLRAFLKRHPVPFPVLIDAYGVAAKRYIRQGDGLKLPGLFLIDRDGVLRAREPGLLDAKGAERLHRRIDALLR